MGPTDGGSSRVPEGLLHCLAEREPAASRATALEFGIGVRQYRGATTTAALGANAGRLVEATLDAAEEPFAAGIEGLSAEFRQRSNVWSIATS
jgi:hypothetical protein